MGTIIILTIAILALIFIIVILYESRKRYKQEVEFFTKMETGDTEDAPVEDTHNYVLNYLWTYYEVRKICMDHLNMHLNRIEVAQICKIARNIYRKDLGLSTDTFLQAAEIWKEQKLEHLHQ
jgi:hypothetical protein